MNIGKKYIHMEFEFFERDSPNIVDKEYDFGFKINESMVLCKLLPNSLFKNIGIRLVIPATSHIGTYEEQLLELVASKAKDMQYQCLTLFVVGNTRLLRWYESQGFVMEMSKPINALRGCDYAYYMRKILV